MNTDRSAKEKKLPAKKRKPVNTDRSGDLESDDPRCGGTWKVEDRVLVLWTAKKTGRHAKPAEVHQAMVTGVIPPQGWTVGAKKRSRQKFHYTLSYRDGDCEGRAAPDVEWDSDSLAEWAWEDGGESTDEDIEHRWC